MAGATEYDAIVLDVMLPGLDGIEVCRRLRQAGIWSPVLLTARDAVEHRVAGLDTGADDYLTKPFSFAELLAPLRALVRRGPVETPPVLELGDLRLDPRTRQVRRNELEIELSTKEFGVLETLMRRPGQVVSRLTSSSTRGTAATRTAPTSSTSTSVTCERRSTDRSGCARSRPCGTGYGLRRDGGVRSEPPRARP
jgi:two-component system OmpR family response regulator